MPIKPLSFKGDRKSKKRKHPSGGSTSNSLTTANPSHTDPTNQSTEDDTWTSPSSTTDVSGPVLIVFPTSSSTSTSSSETSQTFHSLASDPLGAVHPSPLHNLIDNTPHTAEPDSTSQVWICTKIVGTKDEISLKAAHGAYLASDTYGLLSAKREARGVEEGWVLEEIPPGEIRDTNGSSTPIKRDNDGGIPTTDPNSISTADVDRRFRLRASAVEQADVETDTTKTDTAKTTTNSTSNSSAPRTRYLSLVLSPMGTPTLRADDSAKSKDTQLIIRMQSRFKPSHQRQQSVRANEKISRQELERAVGRRLEEDEVRRLKRARKEGTYHEEILDVRVKGKHDKFAS